MPGKAQPEIRMRGELIKYGGGSVEESLRRPPNPEGSEGAGGALNEGGESRGAAGNAAWEERGERGGGAAKRVPKMSGKR